MSVFQELLLSRQLVRHHGQPLWTYALDDDGFHKLSRKLATAVNAEAIDPIDCALYYAEWWKRCYNGGIPSKREVLDSLAGLRVIDDERLFQLARKGGQLLGIRWIKSQNTLYFKTLLLQGGLSVRHMLANRGSTRTSCSRSWKSIRQLLKILLSIAALLPICRKAVGTPRFMNVVFRL